MDRSSTCQQCSRCKKIGGARNPTRIYFQLAEKLSKNKGKKIENYIVDFISAEFNRHK